MRPGPYYRTNNHTNINLALLVMDTGRLTVDVLRVKVVPCGVGGVVGLVAAVPALHTTVGQPHPPIVLLEKFRPKRTEQGAIVLAHLFEHDVRKEFVSLATQLPVRHVGHSLRCFLRGQPIIWDRCECPRVFFEHRVSPLSPREHAECSVAKLVSQLLRSWAVSPSVDCVILNQQ